MILSSRLANGRSMEVWNTGCDGVDVALLAEPGRMMKSEPWQSYSLAVISRPVKRRMQKQPLEVPESLSRDSAFITTLLYTCRNSRTHAPVTPSVWPCMTCTKSTGRCPHPSSSILYAASSSRKCFTRHASAAAGETKSPGSGNTDDSLTLPLAEMGSHVEGSRE